MRRLQLADGSMYILPAVNVFETSLPWIVEAMEVLRVILEEDVQGALHWMERSARNREIVDGART